ncbi:UDP-3-O-(3-hydroxymyristoyl)glucosamine N-acyltransferase [Candidatus Gugararchaeum adminiculabundum]|nr:UDP-3-O-(3-hydroxymyristoyl)glucosamine N-acyltransferase [Candidatus Gugararchaeum adminiculabundum]
MAQRKNIIIGKGTKIAENVTLGEGNEEKLEIGENCLIRSLTIIYGDVTIGNNVKTGHNVLIREKTKIGNNCLIGTGTIIDGTVTIGNNVIVQSGVYIPRDCIIEDNVFLGPMCVLTNDKYPPQPKLQGVTIKKNASIGANATLLPGVIIGENAMVGAASVVTKNVPPGVVVIGSPAKEYCKRKDLGKDMSKGQL